MLEKARKNAKENGYPNVEFRKGDIEKRLPLTITVQTLLSAIAL
jgi:tRNA/tmRNA/rRNA uracil-C5-methylase (TrmA/RlmC/RlmD family)